MSYETCLLKELKEHIKHGDGEISVITRPHGTNEVKVIIKAGKSWTYIIPKYKVVD